MLYYIGDQDVNVMLRRFELAVKADGWRGNVEDVIAKEMKDEEIESQALKSVKKLSDEQFEQLYAAGGNMDALSAAESSNYDTVSVAASSIASSKPSVKMVQNEASIEEDDEDEEPNVDAPESFISALTHK